MGSMDGEWVKFDVKEGDNGQLVAENLVGLYRPIYIPAKAMTNYQGQKKKSYKGDKWVKNLMRYKKNPERFPEITAEKKKDSSLLRCVDLVQDVPRGTCGLSIELLQKLAARNINYNPMEIRYKLSHKNTKFLIKENKE